MSEAEIDWLALALADLADHQNTTGGAAKTGALFDSPEPAARTTFAASAVADMGNDPDERAAIAEFDGRVPREWCDGWSTLQTMTPPVGFTETQWFRLIDDAGRFLDGWAAKAFTLGWTTADVFGFHPKAPMARYDTMGLVGLIDGALVIAMTANTATLRTTTGSLLTAHRKPMIGAVPVWEIK